ncbi:MAG TPA: hypothetical protein VNK41_05135 [Vicinamibacterales bacterium]|nr:hypothetical protein [Vicinamibacterales bacterium]
MRTLPAAAAVSLLLSALPAHAQDGETGARTRAPGWVITPSMSAGLSFDDNPVLAGGGNPTPNDTIGVFGPAVDLTYTAKRTLLDLEYGGSIVRYRTLDEFNSVEQRGRLDLRHKASKRSTLQLTSSYTKAPTTDAANVAGVPYFRSGTRQFDARGGLVLTPTARLGVTSSYAYQNVEFDREDDERLALLQGGQMHTFEFGTSYAVNARLSVGGRYTFRRAIVGRIDEERFNVQDAEGTLAYRISPTTTIEVGAGLARLSLPAEFGSRLGPSAHIRFAQEIDRLAYGIGFMHSFIPAFGIGGSLRNSELSGHVRVPLARRLDWQTDLTWRDAAPVLEGELGLTTLLVHTTVGYAVHRWLRIQGYYSRAHSDTPVAGGEVDRNRVGVQIVTLRPVRVQ